MKQTESTQLSRRGLVAMAGFSAGAALLAPRPLFANPSFGALKQLDAGVLNVAYAEAGPSDGPAVLLLHGWPYDIHSYVDAAPLLAAKRYRVIVPYLRGYGATRFLSSETMRNGQQSVLQWTSSRSWMRSKSSRRSSPASIGERVRSTSWRRSGRNAAKRWSR